MKKQKIFRLHGQVQYYAWGGYNFIPDLLGFDNAQNKPCAEYWLGAHPGGAGKLETREGLELWSDLIQKDPETFLGKKVVERFGDLPYLLKVLDVRDMLSIQVHPTKEEAEKGFDREEEAGVAIDAKNRNYKDRNHKPEVMIALGDFWLLHGFKQESELREVLTTVPEFAPLLSKFEEGGYKGLYEYVMLMPEKEVDNMLLPLIQREKTEGLDKGSPGYWLSKLYETEVPTRNIDRGVFSIYFFNLVHLTAGQGIFQGAGVPHAYLEGQNIELMANSDNVLRGGLTPKHIDVPELMKHIIFEGIQPQVLATEEVQKHEKKYCVAVDDFAICSINLERGREFIGTSRSPEIHLVMEGEVECHGEYKRGEAFLILPGTDYTIRPIQDAVIYKAFVPVD